MTVELAVRASHSTWECVITWPKDSSSPKLGYTLSPEWTAFGCGGLGCLLFKRGRESRDMANFIVKLVFVLSLPDMVRAAHAFEESRS